MARKMTEWPSKRGPITKIMPSDGCIGDTVPLAVGKWYEFHEFGWHMGNVGVSVYSDGLRTLGRCEPKVVGKLLPLFVDVLRSTEDMGWGFYDALRDALEVYYPGVWTAG